MKKGSFTAFDDIFCPCLTKKLSPKGKKLTK